MIVFTRYMVQIYGRVDAHLHGVRFVGIMKKRMGVVSAVREHAGDTEQSDDMTIVVVKREKT